MRACLLVVLLSSSSVWAQSPGAPTPPPPPPPPTMQPPAQHTPPPVYGTRCDAYNRCYAVEPGMSDGQYVGGALTGMFFGFGIGHAVQGRYGQRGWLFTLGEGLALSLMMYAILDDIGDIEDGDSDINFGLFFGSAIGFFALRVAETVDLWTADRGPKQYRYSLGIAPTHGGAQAGLTLRF